MLIFFRNYIIKILEPDTIDFGKYLWPFILVMILCILVALMVLVSVFNSCLHILCRDYVIEIIEDEEDLRLYLWPFAVVVGVCFLVFLVFLVSEFVLIKKNHVFLSDSHISLYSLNVHVLSVDSTQMSSISWSKQTLCSV